MQHIEEYNKSHEKKIFDWFANNGWAQSEDADFEASQVFTKNNIICKYYRAYTHCILIFKQNMLYAQVKNGYAEVLKALNNNFEVELEKRFRLAFSKHMLSDE